MASSERLQIDFFENGSCFSKEVWKIIIVLSYFPFLTLKKSKGVFKYKKGQQILKKKIKYLTAFSKIVPFSTAFQSFQKKTVKNPKKAPQTAVFFRSSRSKKSCRPLLAWFIKRCTR